jgi:hypothetical protein
VPEPSSFLFLGLVGLLVASRNKLLPLVLALFASTASAGLNVHVYQNGPDVQMEATGSLDLTGMVKEVFTVNSSPYVRPSFPLNEPFPSFGFGVPSEVDLYFDNKLIDGPDSFGPGMSTHADSSTGNPFSLLYSGYDIEPGTGVPSYSQIFVPVGYNGGDLSGAATFTNESFASLGLTPGTYVWSWPTDDITLHIGASAVPEPSAIMLMSSVCILAALSRWRAKSSCRCR